MEEDLKQQKNERYLEQEEAWKDTSIDVRQQFHEREQAFLHSKCIKTAKSWFFIVHILYTGILDPDSSLSNLSVELLENIVSFAFSGQAPLVEVNQIRTARRAQVSRVQKSPFKVYIRQRPRLEIELKQKQQRVVMPTANGRAVLVHHAKISRTGKMMTVQHSEWWPFQHAWQEKASNDDVTPLCFIVYLP